MVQLFKILKEQCKSNRICTQSLYNNSLEIKLGKRNANQHCLRPGSPDFPKRAGTCVVCGCKS
jgi:hypothetical protein